MSERERNNPDDLRLGFIWDITSPRLSRRGFLQTMAFASAAGFLAACGSGDDDDSASGGGSKSLNFYNWTEYIADDTIPNFEKETGINVTYDNYNSMDELFAKMRQGNTGYDLVVPTDAPLALMLQAGLLDTIDHSNIPNIKNIDPQFRDPAFDPGLAHSIPWQWGTTGLGYDKTKVEGTVDDWDAFDIASVRGQSSYLDESRDAFAMALFTLGKDPNTTNTDDLDEAMAYLKDLKKKIKKITSDYQEPLKSGELLLAQAYSGDIFQVQDEGNANVEYVIPKSGAYIWLDSMAIPKGAPNKENAERFMNYILEPEVGAALTNYVSYGSPNKAAEPLIDKEITGNPLIYPPDEIRSKLQFQKNLGEDEILYADRWTEVKNA